MWPLLELVLLSWAHVSFATSQPVPNYVYVTYDNFTSSFTLHQDEPPGIFVAAAALLNTVNTTGWAQLAVQTISLGYSDTVQAYAAGLAEGFVSRDLIRLHWINMAEDFCPRPLSPACQKVYDFLKTNLEWVRNQVARFPEDPYWHQVDLFYKQVVGLIHGFQGTPGQMDDGIDPFGLYLLQVEDDLPDLFQKFGNNQSYVPSAQLGHCSAIVKFCPGEYPELVTGHATWSSYKSMLRVQKRYQFQYRMTEHTQENPPGNVIVFPSYPGSLVSRDDFYILSSGMVTMETTIVNYNAALWDHVTAEGVVMEAVRVMVANRLAGSGGEWADTFAKHNSGTYNNQWMVVNYWLFYKSNFELSPGVLTVLEQMPNNVESADVTDVLREHTYWASYNLPYFPNISAVSGTDEMVRRYGDYYSYNRTARARIFQRDHGNVTDTRSAIKLLRYNDFRHDPLSRCPCKPPYSAVNAIAARGDLNDPQGSYPLPSMGHSLSGATDVKVTSFYDAISWMAFAALSGPTNDQQPDFRWSSADPGNTVRHLGQPDLFNFPPVYFNGSGLFPDVFSSA